MCMHRRTWCYVLFSRSSSSTVACLWCFFSLTFQIYNKALSLYAAYLVSHHIYVYRNRMPLVDFFLVWLHFNSNLSFPFLSLQICNENCHVMSNVSVITGFFPSAKRNYFKHSFFSSVVLTKWQLHQQLKGILREKKSQRKNMIEENL